MKSLELYTYNGDVYFINNNGDSEKLSEYSYEFIDEMLMKITECYPNAYEALKKHYKNSSYNIRYYNYLIVRRFCKCNFGLLDDTKSDITECGEFNFERISCPLRGECSYEGVICSPKFNSKISDAELRVMRCIYEGMDVSSTAERLYISPNTVKNHVKSVYCKLGIHEKSEFIKYANKTNLFNHD